MLQQMKFGWEGPLGSTLGPLKAKGRPLGPLAILKFDFADAFYRLAKFFLNHELSIGPDDEPHFFRECRFGNSLRLPAFFLLCQRFKK